MTVLRDGTWSFPTVVNNNLFPFPLWRPGYIVVKAQSATTTAVNSYIYTVEGRAPAGLPPLAEPRQRSHWRRCRCFRSLSRCSPLEPGRSSPSRARCAGSLSLLT